MSRDYQKENDWRKTKYTRILADVDKTLGDDLKQKLKEENQTIASWLTECIKKYLKK